MTSDQFYSWLNSGCPIGNGFKSITPQQQEVYDWWLKAKANGLTYSSFWDRLQRGYSYEEAIQPVDYRNPKTIHTPDGVFESVGKCCRYYGWVRDDGKCKGHIVRDRCKSAALKWRDWHSDSYPVVHKADGRNPTKCKTPLGTFNSFGEAATLHDTDAQTIKRRCLNDYNPKFSNYEIL